MAARSGLSGTLAGLVEVAAQRAGADREHDVVHGEPERRLHLLDVGERHLRERDGAVRGEHTVERAARCGQRDTGRDVFGSRPLHHPDRGAGLPSATRRGTSAGADARSTSPSRGADRRRSARGRAAGSVAGSAAGAGCGSRSKICAMSSTPSAPSMAAWCILAMIPTLPSASPSTTHICQSGRLRSSWRPAISAVSSASSSRPPGRARRPPDVVTRGRSRGPRSTPGGRGRKAPRRHGGGTARCEGGARR